MFKVLQALTVLCPALPALPVRKAIRVCKARLVRQVLIAPCPDRLARKVCPDRRAIRDRWDRKA